MDLKTALKQLESLGSEQTRKTYVRHGVSEPMFGVSYASQGKLKKQIKIDHTLAKGLWASGNHDARILATMIADPAQMTEADLEAWVSVLDNGVLTDALSNLAAQSPFARKKMGAWIRKTDEWTSTAGWIVVARLAAQRGAFEPGELSQLLTRIENEIHTAPNRTRYAMNSAMIAIGGSGGALVEKAIAAAKRIGPVEVDHGDTGCQTPDAASYIEKLAAYQTKRAKPGAKRMANKKAKPRRAAAGV